MQRCYLDWRCLINSLPIHYTPDIASCKGALEVERFFYHDLAIFILIFIGLFLPNCLHRYLYKGPLYIYKPHRIYVYVDYVTYI